MTAPVVNTVFVPGTTITHEWLNGVNDYVNGQHTSDEINYTPPFTGAVTETVTDKLAQTVSVKDFGAVGDGVTDDTTAIQNALDYAASSKKSIFLPIGTYAISQTLQIAEFVTIVGEGRHYSIIDGTHYSMTTPIFTNAATAFIGYINLSNFGIIGGSYGIYFNVTSETAWMNFSDLLIANQSVDNFYVNKLLQTSNFRNCRFTGGNRGVVCAAFTANLNNFYNCEWNNHVYEDVSFINSEVNNFIGCNFGDAPTTANATTIVVTNSNNLNFYGCYFENGHNRLISESGTGVQGNTQFINCHFTGSNINTGYKFDSVATITLDNCSAYYPVVSESNTKLLYIGNQQKVLNASVLAESAVGFNKAVSKPTVYPVSGSLDLVKLDGTGVFGGSCLGTLTVQYQSLESGGLSYIWLYAQYRIYAARLGGAAMTLNNVETITFQYGAPVGHPAITLAIAEDSGASTSDVIVLKGTFTGITAPTGSSLLTWSFDSNGGSDTNSSRYIIPTCYEY